MTNFCKKILIVVMLATLCVVAFSACDSFGGDKLVGCYVREVEGVEDDYDYLTFDSASSNWHASKVHGNGSYTFKKIN